MVLLLVAFAAIGWMAMPVFADEEANAEAQGTAQALPAEEKQEEAGAIAKDPAVVAEPDAEAEHGNAPEAAAEPDAREAAEEEKGSWVFTGGYWHFRTEKGDHLTNAFYSIGGTQYYFDAAGNMAVGWKKLVHGWLYFDKSGAQKFGWLSYGNHWYYLHPQDGTMCAEKFFEVDGKGYSFRPTGEMVTGWVSEGSAWYYYGASGAQHFGWLRDGGVWYYLSKEGEGKMLGKGIYSLGGAQYHFQESGAMSTGWVQDGVNWFYFGSNGAQKFGWLLDGGKWYFLDKVNYGAMFAGRTELLDGKVYCFDNSGVMIKGWKNTDKGWTYYGADGSQIEGWKQVSGYWYYFDTLPHGGTMKKGTVKIGSETHLFQEDGVWVRKLS